MATAVQITPTNPGILTRPLCMSLRQKGTRVITVLSDRMEDCAPPGSIRRFGLKSTGNVCFVAFCAIASFATIVATTLYVAQPIGHVVWSHLPPSNTSLGKLIDEEMELVIGTVIICFIFAWCYDQYDQRRQESKYPYLLRNPTEKKSLSRYEWIQRGKSLTVSMLVISLLAASVHYGLHRSPHFAMLRETEPFTERAIDVLDGALIGGVLYGAAAIIIVCFNEWKKEQQPFIEAYETRRAHYRYLEMAESTRGE